MKVFKCKYPAKNQGVTIKDCEGCDLYRAKDVVTVTTTIKRKLLLTVNGLSPGDVLVMTAAIETLHLRYPGQFLVAVKSSCSKELFEHNPGITAFMEGETGIETISMHYPLIDQSDREPVHFLAGFCRWLGEKLKLPLEAAVNHPMLYLSEDEKRWTPQVQELVGTRIPYWVVNAGHKLDFTAKFWGFRNYQATADLLQGKVQFVQIGEAVANENHVHKPLDGVINLIGKTDTRQLLRLCWHAIGGLGPSTFIQHIFAAFHKPYVCLLGGREPVAWVQYAKQTTLHTIGALPCCRDKACWKSRTVKLNDGKDKSLCELPVLFPEPVPKCLSMITPMQVASEVLKYSQTP